MICPTCYFPLDDPSYFCVACGRSTNAPAQVRRKMPVSRLVMWGILLIGGLTGGPYVLNETLRMIVPGPCGRGTPMIGDAVELGSAGIVSLTRFQYRTVAERQGFAVTDSGDNLILTNGAKGYLLVSFQKNWIGATVKGQAFDGRQDITCERAVDLRMLANAVENEY